MRLAVAAVVGPWIRLLLIVVAGLSGSTAADAQPSVGQIVVEVQPAERAMIYVDGVQIGPAPAIATNLWPGSHVVVARTEWGGRVEQAVEVRAGESSSTRLTLPAAPAPVAPPPPSPVPAPTVVTPPPSPPTPARVEQQAQATEVVLGQGAQRDTRPINVSSPRVADPPPGGWSGGTRGSPNGLLWAGIAVGLLGGSLAITGYVLQDDMTDGGADVLMLSGEIVLIPAGLFLLLGIALPWSPGPAEEAGQRFGALYPTLAMGSHGATVGVGGTL